MGDLLSQTGGWLLWIQYITDITIGKEKKSSDIVAALSWSG